MRPALHSATERSRVERPKRSSVFERAAFAIGPVVFAAVLGGLATRPNVTGWYDSLERPTFTPPDWVFGPVWSVLYVMMIVAVWRILARPSPEPGRTRALVSFYVQLALNAAWSWAFFALQSPLAGLVVILALLVGIVVTIGAFWRLDRLAASLLIPYALWVGYATALNAGFYALNR